MARLDYYFRETVIGLKRNGLVVFAAISTAFIALFLFGMALLIQREVSLIVSSATGRVEVVVYLSDEIGSANRDRLNGILTEMPEVDEVSYESKAQAYEKAQDLFGKDSEIIQNVRPDAFPASFRVKLVDPEQYAVVEARLAGEAGVDEISAQQEFLERLFAVTRIFRIGVLILAVVMLVSAAILIANTVRMGLFARRKEIGIMKLVGATNWRIRVPFLIEGVVEGLVGAAIAITALFAIKVAFINPLYGNLTFIPWIQDGDLIATIPWMLGAGVVVAVIASLAGMRRFLDI